MHTDPAVTVDVVQQVTRGKEQAFEALLEQMISTASTFEVYLGASVFRPSGQDEHEYRIVFKFDHLENLKRWEHSSVRQRFLSQARYLTVDAGTFSIMTRLETWFTLPASRSTQTRSSYSRPA
ncbi:antibiotic biosynthesis monooxygenase [Leptolyngbya sp. FACHB-321]|uniref:antibiotic biosynthesis monooxygenase n=1 Tax=Leptolyngbya sp. FACHB-321 TaxID=2692807 RepID=UPI001681D0C8|nr:antibiotic biosynthesis monooxygenase [Leptolyngbya sp. FACHB-321]MBD2034052.1 antibiotic biosynthesis monooxygenase [Leptolyngbya sp. FACHB-321]